MAVGGVGSAAMNSIVNLQKTTAGSTDIKSKKIQNEISEAQQQMQKLSSQEELSAEEKTEEKEKLQKEISTLNTELERQQEEFLRAQKREQMLAELRGEAEPAAEETTGTVQAQEEEQSAQQTGIQDTVILKNSDGTVILKGETESGDTSGAVTAESGAQDMAVAESQATAEEENSGKETAAEEEDDEDTETGLSQGQIQAMAAADISAQQAGSQEAVIARISGGIAVLKGEIAQDERRGVDTDRKQAELEKLEEKENKARILQFSVLGEANGAMKSSAETEAAVQQQDDGQGDNAAVRAAKFAQEEQQRFYVSVG
ncbi:MAG: hypothetical protein NC416_04650 [Eubacterium sp.]|nr:hypothetical protein [Eubacterium sp.]